jgi:hypothetical protein
MTNSSDEIVPDFATLVLEQKVVVGITPVIMLQANEIRASEASTQ